MFVLKVNYIKPIEEVDIYLDAHRKFLDEMYKRGLIVASGPQIPRRGGVILCAARTLQEAEEMYHRDPFYIKGVAEYELTQFSVTKHNVENFCSTFED